MLEAVADHIDKLVIRSEEGMEVNCYLIKGKKGVTVIDTGNYSKQGIQTWEKIFDMGITIEKVVLTHTHQDHIGLAKWFQQTKGIPVTVSRLGYREMQKNCHPDFEQTFDSMIKRHGVSELPVIFQTGSFIYDFEPDAFFDHDQQIQLGDDLYDVVWTPGHAPDHYCFYQPEKKIMIAGDHILQNIAPVIGLWLGEEDNLLKDYFHSLELMKNYQTELALPGHGEVIHHFNERVDNTKHRHEHRLKQVLDLIASEGKSAEQVCRQIYGQINVFSFISQFMATLTRLIYLEAAGKVKREMKNGIALFHSV